MTRREGQIVFDRTIAVPFSARPQFSAVMIACHGLVLQRCRPSSEAVTVLLRSRWGSNRLRPRWRSHRSLDEIQHFIIAVSPVGILLIAAVTCWGRWQLTSTCTNPSIGLTLLLDNIHYTKGCCREVAVPFCAGARVSAVNIRKSPGTTSFW